MSLIYPNLVPKNNLRLPDALTVRHGPAPLLSRFVLACDVYARRVGLRLRLSYDFDELVYLNKHYVKQGSWYPLLGEFNPQTSDLRPENAFWISGIDADDQVAGTYAGHIYYWPDTNLEEQAVTVFYGRDEGQTAIVTTPVAKTISGVVMSGGAAWVRPDYRGKKLSHLFPRIAKAYGLSRWPLDWLIGYVDAAGYKKGLHTFYGARHTSPSVFYPESIFGEAILLYTSAAEAYEDLEGFLATELSVVKDEAPAVSPETILAQEVTNTSPEPVFHGSSNLS